MCVIYLQGARLDNVAEVFYGSRKEFTLLDLKCDSCLFKALEYLIYVLDMILDVVGKYDYIV